MIRWFAYSRLCIWNAVTTEEYAFSYAKWTRPTEKFAIQSYTAHFFRPSGTVLRTGRLSIMSIGF